MTTIKILGTTQDNTTCDNCGKTNLKKTVVLDIDGSVAYYGIDCAASVMTGSKKNAKVIDQNSAVVQIAKSLLAKGYAAREVANHIGRKYGYLTGTKDNAIIIGDFGIITF